ICAGRRPRSTGAASCRLRKASSSARCNRQRSGLVVDPLARCASSRYPRSRPRVYRSRLRGALALRRLAGGLHALGRALGCLRAFGVTVALGGEELDRLAQRDRVGAILVGQCRVDCAVLDVRTVAARVQLDGPLVLGMRTENAQRCGTAPGLCALGALLRLELEVDLAVRLADQ